MGKHAKTLARMQKRPLPRNLAFADIESLLRHLGAEVFERGGSGISFRANDVVWAVHRPHPQKEAKPYVIEQALNFIRLAGL